MEIYFTFKSTHTVILAERVLLSAGFEVKVRPVPSAIRAGCGLCLCIDGELKQKAQAELQKHNAIPEAAYYQKEKNFVLID